MANRFGTTSDMILQEVEEQGNTYFLAIDKKGLYLTTKEKLNSPLADPNRYTGLRENTASRLSSLGLDPTALFSQNQHLVKTDAKESSKKVNPLKASKRASKS